MQLAVQAVNWATVLELHKAGRLEELMCSDDVDSIYVGNAPWPSDSCVQYTEVAEAYSAIRGHLPSATRAVADSITTCLINEDFKLPNDLGPDIDGELVAGAISPPRVVELLSAFSNLNYVDLDNAFDNQLPPSKRSELQICSLGASQNVFTGYLRQWHDLLRYANSNNAGIFFHLG